jgi:hypothetical protein
VKCAALLLYGFAFLLQAAGAWGVISDVRASIRNMRQLKADLTGADNETDAHAQRIRDFGGSGPRAGKRLAANADEYAEHVGPGATAQRKAVLTYVTAQNNVSDCRRWTAVGLLVVGVVVGFAGNAASLYPWW